MCLCQAAASARPVDRNPMGLSADDLDASKWRSESQGATGQTASETEGREMAVAKHDRSSSEGVTACLTAPLFSPVSLDRKRGAV